MTDEDRQTLEWIRSRPSCVQALMRKFPPSCKVLATRQLVCPAPGRTGVVASYFEDGTLSVQDEEVWLGLSDRHRSACCAPEWLVVIGHLGNMTPDWVERVQDGENIAPIRED